MMSVQNKFSVGDKVILADREYAERFFPSYNGEELTITWIDDDFYGSFVETDRGVGAYDSWFRLVEDSPTPQEDSWYESGGLPPVGANIEYKLGAGPWYEATVKYVLDVLDGDEDEIVIACPHLGFERLLTLNKHTKIRPALSPEEIAQQDREKAIADVEGAICNQMGSLNVRELAEYLVDKYNFRVEEE